MHDDEDLLHPFRPYSSEAATTMRSRRSASGNEPRNSGARIRCAAEELAERRHNFGQLTCAIDLIGPDLDIRLNLRDGLLVGYHRVGRSDLSMTTKTATLLPLSYPHQDPWDSAQAWVVGNREVAPRLVPPLDLCDLRWAADLPEVPRATVHWATTVTGTPFGDLSITYRVVDGRPLEVGPGVANDVDAWFRVPARRFVAARSGRISVPEMISEGGDLGGDFDAVLVIAGLLETPPWVEARRLDEQTAGVLDLFFRVAESGLFRQLDASMGRTP